MKILLPIYLLLSSLTAFGADFKISDLPLATSPSTNTFLEIADMDAVTKSSKYLLTNLVTGAQVPAYQTNATLASLGGVTNSVAGITNALGYVPVNKAGDTNTGSQSYSGTTIAGVRLNRLTTTQRDALVGVETNAGSLLWNSTQSRVNVHNGSAWTDGFVRLAGDTNSSALFEFGSLQINTQLTLSNDVKLVRDAANTLALRNGANAQQFNIYETYTDASNFGRLKIVFDGSNWMIDTYQKAGTGSARNLLLNGSGLSFLTGNTSRWIIGADGHLVTALDNTYDIGASSANRPRSIFVGPSGGFGSSATNTVTTSATGATNTLGVNVVLYVTAATSAALTDNAGTTEFSGVTIANFTPIRLQPGGKFTGTSITYATGTSSHAW